MPARRVCYYKVLGIPVRATEEEIKRAFRVLALRWHPDRNPEKPQATERFREALEAYETLVDPSSRTRYDRLKGYVPSRRRSQRDFSDDEEERPQKKPASWEDVLQEFFGVELERTRRVGVTDLRFDVQIPRSAIPTGVCEEICYSRIVFCDTCRNGNGNGKRPSRACAKCNGEGEVEETCFLNVQIPAGIRHGARIRIHGAGDRIAPGIPPGDLVILVSVVDVH